MKHDKPFVSRVEIDHVEIFVPDRLAAAKWYARVLGLRPVSKWARWATPAGPLMISAGGGRSMIAIFERPPCGEPGPGEHHRIAFRVDGPAFVSFVSKGPAGPVYNEAGSALTQLRPIDHGGAFSVYFCDPWGNRCEVTTYDARHVASQQDPTWISESARKARKRPGSTPARRSPKAGGRSATRDSRS